jgi:hypothetical protein
VGNDFGVDVVGDHLDDGEGGALDLVGLEGGEGPEQLVGAGGCLSVYCVGDKSSMEMGHTWEIQ